MNWTTLEFCHDAAMRKMVVVRENVRGKFTYIRVKFVSGAVKTEDQGTIVMRFRDNLEITQKGSWRIGKLSVLIYGGGGRGGGGGGHCGWWTVVEKEKGWGDDCVVDLPGVNLSKSNMLEEKAESATRGWKRNQCLPTGIATGDHRTQPICLRRGWGEMGKD